MTTASDVKNVAHHVHTEEMGYWYPADEFEIGTEVVTVEPAPIEDLLNS